jgi:transposase
MAMGTRQTDQRPLWIATSDLPTSPGHPFYTRLNAALDAAKFDPFVEGLCQRFYAPTMGRPSLAPGRYFRLLLLGYFEGIDAERGIAWRAADSLAVREFLRLGLHETAPDHSTISRTRRLIDLETHRAVFTWVQQRLVEAGLLKGKTVAFDATTLEANAAMRSIVRRDTGESYQEFLTKLAQASGIKTPTREALARLDRRRKKRTSNTDWTNPYEPDAKITKMKDGRWRLAHKAEHAVDLETGAIVAVTVHGADEGDTSTIVETAIAAAHQVEDAQADVDEPTTLQEAVADKGYHSNQTMVDFQAVGVRTYFSEPDRGRRDWSKEPDGATPRARQPTTHSRHARQGVAPAPRRVRGALVRARLRYRWDAAHAPARAHEHPQAAPGPRRRLQPRPPDAPDRGRREAPPPPGRLCRCSSGPCRRVRSALRPVGRLQRPCAPCCRVEREPARVGQSNNPKPLKSDFCHGLLSGLHLRRPPEGAAGNRCLAKELFLGTLARPAQQR